MRTASFKLAALYALIFGVSVAALAAVVYVIATAALDSQMRTRIVFEATELSREYGAGGLDQMLAAIHKRQRGRLAGGLDYTVYDSHADRLFGTLPLSAFVTGWSERTGPPDGDEPAGEVEHLAVYSVALGKGDRLMIVDDIGRVRKLGRVIMTTFGSALALMITLAAVGGIALSIGFLGRVDAITRTAEAIIGGNIHRRIPMRGTADDLDRLAATLNRMLDRITTLMDSVRLVSNDIAHDLRTPLGRLRHTLDEARHTAVTMADYEKAVDRAIGESDAILETFAALLRIAQIESGSRRTGFRAVDLSALVTSIGQTFAPVAEDEGRSLFFRADPGIGIEGDRELLTQMLANLIENAIGHTGAGARIAVTLSTGHNGPVLTVADNGPGIPPAERGNVLKRFYRLEQSRTTPGSGLGLSLVAAIAELHGAAVALEDNAPGLRVVLQFPVRQSAAVRAGAAHADAVSGTDPGNAPAFGAD